MARTGHFGQLRTNMASSAPAQQVRTPNMQRVRQVQHTVHQACIQEAMSTCGWPPDPLRSLQQDRLAQGNDGSSPGARLPRAAGAQQLRRRGTVSGGSWQQRRAACRACAACRCAAAAISDSWQEESRAPARAMAAAAVVRRSGQARQHTQPSPQPRQTAERRISQRLHTQPRPRQHSRSDASHGAHQAAGRARQHDSPEPATTGTAHA